MSGEGRFAANATGKVPRGKRRQMILNAPLSIEHGAANIIIKYYIIRYL